MDFLPRLPISSSLTLALGLLLCLGAFGGYLATRVSWLPSITGFMVAGFALGPSGANLLTHALLNDGAVVVDTILALVLYQLGLSLDLRAARQHPQAVLVALAEGTITLAAVFCGLRWLGLEPLLAAVIASIAVSSSPAVLLHVSHEVGAHGPVTTGAMVQVALNNLLSFLAFVAFLPAVHLQSGAAWHIVILQPLYRLLGSLAVGVSLAALQHLALSRCLQLRPFRHAVVLGVLLLALGLAESLGLSLLLAPLALGIAVRSVTTESSLHRVDLGEVSSLLFLTLFVYAGASLHWRELVSWWPAVITVVLARSLAKLTTFCTAARALGLSARQGAASGLLLLPLAGLAIGLVQTSRNLLPGEAETVAAIVLGAVTVFELCGPPLAAWAFALAGEAHGSDGGNVPHQPVP